jgi:hypothetical protein
MAKKPQTTNDIGARAAAFQHPLYSQHLPIWQQLSDVRTGQGGFLDGTYLVAHPREWLDFTAERPVKPSKKLKARRALAAYENFASTIISAFKAGVFREQPIRRVGPQGEKASETPTALQDWWQDVDGRGTSIDDHQMIAWDAAGTFGHVFLYMDRAPSPGDPPLTAADAAPPYVRIYAPADVPDWVEDDRGELTAVKFLELEPRPDLMAPHELDRRRYRIVDTERWRLYNKQGQLIDQGEHGMGMLPVVRLYAQRIPQQPGIGQSLLDNPKLFIDLYNLRSELRELLRNQTFSVLNIPIGTGQDALTVQQLKEMNSGSIGTEDVIFSGSAAAFISADAANVAAYQEEIHRCLRHIYRLAALQWESDTKDAEAEGSLKLKREDMNQRLAQLADELEKADYSLAKLWYRATYGVDAGDQRFEKDQIQILYPQTFHETPFDQLLEQSQAAISLGMPALFLKELRKRLVSKFLPDAPDEVIQQVNKAIDTQPDDLTPDQQMRLKVEGALGAVKGERKPFEKKEAA